MIDLLSLYRQAERDNIGVYWFTMEGAESLSIAAPDGSCAIAMDPWYLRTRAEERAKLAHELGHCEAGSFYNQSAALDVRQKHEIRADKWAIKKLVPVDELDSAVADGCTDLWSLAERFGVPEDFMKRAVCWYTHGNLAAELYF